MFTWNNGADPQIIDQWLQVRGLLSDRQAYCHMKSLWASLISQKWVLDFGKRNYHYFDLQKNCYCRLDGSENMPNMDIMLYGENFGKISTLDSKKNEDHNDEGDAIFLTQNSMMEVIHAGDMCLNEETDLFSQRSMMEIEEITNNYHLELSYDLVEESLNDHFDLSQKDLDDLENEFLRSQAQDDDTSIVSEQIIMSDKFDIQSLSQNTLQEINILHQMAINIEDGDEMDEFQDGASINSKQHDCCHIIFLKCVS